MEMTEAEYRDAIEECAEDAKRGDSEMNEWTVVPPEPEPRPPLELKYRESITATIQADGCVEVHDAEDFFNCAATRDVRWLIASLQSILVLAQEHFGEDWGK